MPHTHRPLDGHESGFTGSRGPAESNRKRCLLRSVGILPLLVIVPLLGCDGAGDWLRAPGAATAYAVPLARDTTVVTTRRVWSSAADTTVSISLDPGSIMPDGAGMAVTDWTSGDPAVFDLTTRKFRRFHLNDEPYDRGIALQTVASPDGSRIAFYWQNWLEPPEVYLRVVDIATGESVTLLSPDTAIVSYLAPVAWTPAGDSVFALMWPAPYQDGDVEVVLTPAAGGTPRLVHTIPRIAGGGEEVPGLSPDGRWLLYNHELSRNQQARSDIYIIDVQGGGARPLVEHPAVDLLVGWLPGTDVVLFSSDRSGTTDLWGVRVVNGRASGEPRLVRSGFFRSQAVGFGGGALFYRVTTGSSGPAIVNVDPQSGALLGAASPPLAGFDRSFYRGWAWSPDGQTFASSTRERGLHVITLHSMETGESRVFWMDKGVTPYTVQWAADGRALFLRAGEAGSSIRSPHHFLRLDLVTGTTTRLFEAADTAVSATFGLLFRATPDGRSVVLLRQRHTVDDDQTRMRLVLRSLEDGRERELHRTSGVIPEFSLSADGTQLAFMQQVWEDSDSLFVMRMDGTQPLRAVASWDYDVVSLLGWLPAGNALLAARLTEDGKAEEILRVDLDGATTVVGISPFQPGRGARGVQGARRSRLVLSPAGDRLVHNVSDLGEELWRMDGLHKLFARDGAGRR
ncbi:MAG: TolB family protein [Gemmatimonadales bacterium]